MTVLPSRLSVAHSAISLTGAIPKLTDESTDEVPQANQREQAVLRSRPRQAGEHQVQEHRCRS